MSVPPLVTSTSTSSSPSSSRIARIPVDRMLPNWSTAVRFDVPVAGDHREELVVVEIVGVHHRLDLLAVVEVDEVG